MNKDEKQELKEQLIKKTKDIGQGFKRSPEQLCQNRAWCVGLLYCGNGCNMLLLVAGWRDIRRRSRHKA